MNGDNESYRSITLNREQIGKLNEMVYHFGEVDKFTVETNGPDVGGLSVRFCLFNDDGTNNEETRARLDRYDELHGIKRNQEKDIVIVSGLSVKFDR